MRCQDDEEKYLRLVVCMSRKVNRHEVNYPVHEKEPLDLVESTKSGNTTLTGCLHRQHRQLRTEIRSNHGKAVHAPNLMAAPTPGIRLSIHHRKDEHRGGHLEPKARGLEIRRALRNHSPDSQHCLDARIQYLNSSANGHSAITEILEPILTVLQETTIKKSH